MGKVNKKWVSTGGSNKRVGLRKIGEGAPLLGNVVRVKGRREFACPEHIPESTQRPVIVGQATTPLAGEPWPTCYRCGGRLERWPTNRATLQRAAGVSLIDGFHRNRRKGLRTG